MIGIIGLLAWSAFAQEPTKYVFAGSSYDSTSTPGVKAVFGSAVPLADRVLMYTAVQISAVEGKPLKDLLQVSNLLFSFKVGPTYKIYQINKRISVWGIAQGGLAAGGATDARENVPMSGSFAYGGFLDIALTERIGINPMLQRDWDARTGWKLLPTLMIRYKL
jgi:hypothetical protein